MSNKPITRETFNDITPVFRAQYYEFGRMIENCHKHFCKDDLISDDSYTMMLMEDISLEDFSMATPIVLGGLDALREWFEGHGKIGNVQVFPTETGFQARMMIMGLSAVECNEIVPSFKHELLLSECDPDTIQVVTNAYEEHEPREGLTIEDLIQMKGVLDDILDD